MTIADKTQEAEENTDGGADLTEEEWNLRVAELNKHQVGLCGHNPMTNTT